MTNLSLFCVGLGNLAGHTTLRSSPQERERNNRVTPYMPHMENGIGMAEHFSASMVGNAFPMAHGNHRSPASSSHQIDRVIPSPVIVSSRYIFFFHLLIKNKQKKNHFIYYLHHLYSE